MYNIIEATIFCLIAIKLKTKDLLTNSNRILLFTFGSWSIEKSFLPSCFEIICEGFLWIQQRN